MELQTELSLGGLHSLTGSLLISQSIYVFTLMTKTHRKGDIGRSEMRCSFSISLTLISVIIKNNKFHE